MFTGSEKIPYSDITNLQSETPNLIVYALPLVFLFVIIEAVYARYSQKSFYSTRETLGSTLVGVGNLLISSIVKIGLIYGAVAIYNLVPWRFDAAWWTFIPCYLLYDFCSYWSHRLSHTIRFFWATHVVHHSAEHYNLTVSFRQSWVQHFKVIFFLPIAFAGFHPIIFFLANQVSTLYQFWVHTECIGKLHPVVEYIFGTPSNHRVHHGSQPKYLDKNFGVTFMIWDHLFGSFQAEEDRPDYGLTHKLEYQIDPLYLNFHEYRDIIHDMKAAPGWKEKMFYLFASPASIARKKKVLSPVDHSSNDVSTLTSSQAS